MIRYLIINNFKLMLRNKWVIALMLIGPILVIAILSSAFENMMASYESRDSFRAGIQASKDSPFYSSMEEIKKAGSTAGIEFESYPDGEPETLIEQNELSGFLAFDKDSYKIYKSADYKSEGEILEYFMEQVKLQAINSAAAFAPPAAYAPAGASIPPAEYAPTDASIPTVASAPTDAPIPPVDSTTSSEGNPSQNMDITLPTEKLSFMPYIDSKNYYGIIEVVYFIYCSIVCLAGVLASEKKNGISKKFKVSALSESRLYFARWIPAVLTTAIETALTVFLTIILFDITWGGNPISILVLFLTITCAISFGLFLYAVCNNLAITVVVLFTVVWFIGFFGGSFETYLFSSVPDYLKNISPIYYANRTLVEYSCMGKSSYTLSCILYLCGITVVCTIMSILVNKMRKKA